MVTLAGALGELSSTQMALLRERKNREVMDRLAATLARVLARYKFDDEGDKDVSALKDLLSDYLMTT